MINAFMGSLPYLLVSFFLLILCLINEFDRKKTGRDNKILVIMAYVVLILFIGLRGFVMTDFLSYYPFFETIDASDGFLKAIQDSGWEPGFVIYALLCKTLIPNYFAWNVISCIIDLAILYKVLKRYSCNHLFSLLVFFIVGGLPLEMNVLRNAKAIFIFLLSIKYIEERKFVKYLLMILLAMTFHVSSIFYLPLYFVVNKKWPKWVLSAIFICGCVILFARIELVSNLIGQVEMSMDGESRIEYLASNYLFGDMSSYGASFGTVERIVTYLIVSIVYIKNIPQKDTDIIFYNMYFLLFVVFFYLSESHILVQRLQYLVIPSFWILYPSMFRYLKKKRIEVLKFLFVLFLMIKAFMVGLIPENRYENVLFGIDSFEERHRAIGFR